MARKDRKQKEKRPSMPIVIGAGITEDICSDSKLELAYQRANELADTGESYTHIPKMLELCGTINNP